MNGVVVEIKAEPVDPFDRLRVFKNIFGRDAVEREVGGLPLGVPADLLPLHCFDLVIAIITGQDLGPFLEVDSDVFQYPDQPEVDPVFIPAFAAPAGEVLVVEVL